MRVVGFMVAAADCPSSLRPRRTGEANGKDLSQSRCELLMVVMRRISRDDGGSNDDDMCSNV